MKILGKLFSLGGLCLILTLTGCPQPQDTAEADLNMPPSALSWDMTSPKRRILVAIPPQITFVKAIAGDTAQVFSILTATQEIDERPRPERLVLLQEAEIFFGVGAPFERHEKFPPTVNRVKLSEKIDLRSFSSHTRYLNAPRNNKIDPHFWLAPSNVVHMLQPIYLALREAGKTDYEVLQQRYTRLVRRLNQLEGEIHAMVSRHNALNREFYTNHPVLGYYAKDFGFKQTYFTAVAGKNHHDLARQAIKDNVRTIFFGPHLPPQAAQTLPTLIGGAVAALNPMRPDYFNNLHEITRAITDPLQKTLSSSLPAATP